MGHAEDWADNGALTIAVLGRLGRYTPCFGKVFGAGRRRGTFWKSSPQPPLPSHSLSNRSHECLTSVHLCKKTLPAHYVNCLTAIQYSLPRSERRDALSPCTLTQSTARITGLTASTPRIGWMMVKLLRHHVPHMSTIRRLRQFRPVCAGILAMLTPSNSVEEPQPMK